jgi:hypothetical protein
LDPNGKHKKWGYILWDNDAVFGFYINYTGIPTKAANAAPCNVENLNVDPNGHMEILAQLRNNPSFDHYYISRYIDLANTVFSCNTMIPTLDSIVNVIDPEMDRHAQRWFGTYSEWKSNVQQLRDYILERCDSFQTKMDSCYSLNGPYPITLQVFPYGSGKIKVNSLTFSDFPWTGDYYGGIPVYFTGIPDTLNGFVFDHWVVNNNTMLPSLLFPNGQMNVHAGDTITAYFVQHAVGINPNQYEDISVVALPSVFSKKTEVKFFLKESDAISVNVYSSMGQQVMQLRSENFKAGIHNITLDFSGKGITPGIYLLNLNARKTNRTIRVIYTGE